MCSGAATAAATATAAASITRRYAQRPLFVNPPITCTRLLPATPAEQASARRLLGELDAGTRAPAHAPPQTSSGLAAATGRVEGMLARNAIPTLMRDMGISDVEHWFRSRAELDRFLRTLRPGRSYLVMVVGEEAATSGSRGAGVTAGAPRSGGAVGAVPPGTQSWTWARDVGVTGPVVEGEHLAQVSRLAEETRGLSLAEPEAVWDILGDVHASMSGDAAAQDRLRARNLHRLGIREGANSNFQGWWSVDITGRQNPNRFIYEISRDNTSFQWRVRNTHGG